MSVIQILLVLTIGHCSVFISLIMCAILTGEAIDNLKSKGQN